MTLLVRRAGALTTVQDLGRYGYGALGVSASGAADSVALRLGNRLVGNEEGAAALEMTLVGGTFEFPEDAVIALAGSELECRAVPAGGVVEVGPLRAGARAYLCMRGGIVVPPFLGSASTHVATGLGGRIVRAGDALEIGSAAGNMRAVAGWARERLARRNTLRVTPGPQADWFRGADDRVLSSAGMAGHEIRWPAPPRLDSEYEVSEQSNRMGLRLAGASLAPVGAARSMLTEGAPVGAIQVPPGGQPIILFVEQQTTGGYPKIANVIAADLASVGQLRPRDRVRFEHVTPVEARALLADQERTIAASDTVDLNCDMGEIAAQVDDGTQERLMESVTSVNVACGGHAGDERLMEATIRQALVHGVAVGAHPGYPDRENFGRLAMDLPLEAVERSVFEQITALTRIAERCGARIGYVKAHGALYNQAARDAGLARAIAAGVARWRRGIVLVGLAGSTMLEVFRGAGFETAAEGFADRAYEPDGSLRPRRLPGALIEEPEAAARQAVDLAERGPARTLCIHGDTPGAPAIVAAVARALRSARYRISAFAAPQHRADFS